MEQTDPVIVSKRRWSPVPPGDHLQRFIATEPTLTSASSSAGSCSLCLDLQCIDRLAGAHEQEVALRATEHQIRARLGQPNTDRKSTRLNSSHVAISYAVFCSKKKTTIRHAAC